MDRQDLKDKSSIGFWEKIGFRLSLGILVPLCICTYALVSISGFYNYYTGSFELYNEKKDSIQQTWTNVRLYELSYRVNLAELKLALERYITGDKKQFKPKVESLLKEFETDLGHVHTLSGDANRPDSKKVYGGIHGTIQYFHDYVSRMEQEKLDAGRIEEERQRIQSLTQDLEQSLKRLKARFELFELQDLDTIKGQYEQIRNDTMELTLIVLISGLMLCAIVTLTISLPVNKVIMRLRDIAFGDGDLTKRIQTHAIGEMRVVAVLMNRFLDTIHEIVYTIRSAAETIKDSVSQVSRHTQATTISATEINRTMMTQSMSLEDCSISLSRIDELLQSTSESSRQAASLSRLAMDRALKGGSSVQETVGAMEKIEESAKKVEFLVGSINSIATQTNLLAINAAIEASKAGEHGKGFAVVAEEVRKLAERSKNLTVEVTDLISEVNTRVKVGSNLARGAGVALDGIIKDVEAVASLIQRIAAASTKQTESSSQLLTAIQEVNQAVRQNLSNMQRVSKGAEIAGMEIEKLDGMMIQLNNIVRQFKLRDDVQAPDEEINSLYFEYQGNAGLMRIPDTVSAEKEIPSAGESYSKESQSEFFTTDELSDGIQQPDARPSLAVDDVDINAEEDSENEEVA